MTVKVRFAPSPTGRLHVGNVRTALINWLFARKQAGQFVLRIDDTDTERSTAEFEHQIRADLTWLGLGWDDSFSQSDRFGEYDGAAEKLKQAGLLYPCYETADEIERKRKIALSRGRPPVYDRAALELSEAERAGLEAEGRAPHWRFKLSGKRVEWEDLVRGGQGVETDSLSDPILIRGDGTYLYTLPSVVDDIDAAITHVVRGEDHVTNSGAQIEIFRALGAQPPAMAHTPLLVGADGQGLSKRLGSLSIAELAENGIEPLAIASLLAKIGTSDPVAVSDSLDALVAAFDFSKIGRAAARFDEGELLQLNAEIVHAKPFAAVRGCLEAIDSRAAREDYWLAVRANCARVRDAGDFVAMAFGDVEPVVGDEDRDFIAKAGALLPAGELDDDSWSVWTDALKAATGRKGKSLFMPLRLALTGQPRGPEMSALLPLIGRDKLLARLQAAQG